MRTISVEQRRRLIARRHRLGGEAGSAEDAVRAMVALHASDPASVFLSVLARSATSTLQEVSAAMYGRRTVVRWMAMRRTLFLLLTDDVPVVHAAAGAPLAATLRGRLIGQLTRNGTDPPIERDVAAWVAEAENQVVAALDARGSATGAQLRDDVPALATRIVPRAASDRPQSVTTPLLTLMSAGGALVRGTPTGPWTSRVHRWEPVSKWWPEGLPELDPDHARSTLARRWLERFGPATVDDLQWWTGWTKAATRDALARVEIEPVDLHGSPGIGLAGREGDEGASEPVAALLPALDPTPMGYKRRDWFLGVEADRIFDRAGNIGPTIWWDGEVVGSWAVAPSGDVRTAILADRGGDAAEAVRQAAERLRERLEGAVVTPAARTPLERELSPPD